VRIVRAWQSHGASVAMTGDGVNDGPALKAADIGIALGSGTEVAKQTSDLVLLDNNLATVVAAIKQGRILFDNIRKIVLYLLSDSTSELLLIVSALVFGLPLPILPAQMLWINLVTDGFPHLALTFEPGEKDIMQDRPRKRTEPLLNAQMKRLILLISLITNLGLFGLYGYLLTTGAELDFIRTMIFTALGIDSLLYVFSIRSLRSTIFQINPWQNKLLVGAVGLGFLFLLAPLVLPTFRDLFGFVPLGLLEWVLLVMMGLIEVVLIEWAKYVFAPARLRPT
jgi:Ca2+-transporting ATPase